MGVRYVSGSRYGLGANGLKIVQISRKKIVSSYYNGNSRKDRCLYVNMFHRKRLLAIRLEIPPWDGLKNSFVKFS